MRTFATKQPNQQDATHQKPVRANPKPVVRSPFPGLTDSAILQRKPACACGGGCPRCQEADLLQTKLKISEPNDQYEQEADRVAESVLNGDRSLLGGISHSIQPKLHREVLEPDEKFDSITPFLHEPESEALATEPAVEEVQRSATEEAGVVTPQYEQSLHQAINHGGEPLPAATRSFMENRFGSDFSSVQVHTDREASTLAQSINARAFTLGNNIFFAQSQFDPISQKGQRLLAHELTHVVQQSDGRLSRQIQRSPGTACTRYPGYDASVDRLTYNCAGLALRTYNWISPPSAVYQAINANFLNPVCPVGNCRGGQVKLWLWEYDIHTEDDLGRIIDPPWHDFHIVGGRSDAIGGDPTDVYSKNGPRPIHGPASGPSFRPATRDRALDRDDNPGSTPDGRPLYKVRYNMREQITCANCY